MGYREDGSLGKFCVRYGYKENDGGIAMFRTVSFDEAMEALKDGTTVYLLLPRDENALEFNADEYDSAMSLEGFSLKDLHEGEWRIKI